APAVESGAHPTRQPGRRPAHHQLRKAKGSTDSVGGPSRKIEAKDYRDQLMQERKFFVDEHNEQLYEREFSLCEH
ncbi:hypothetical protein, partial [Streptomyces plumbiresistens]|uniref:hypothetical protein n=1 Tax=Streptomyces plumbiresistens TaxID=511811 RepID=UPI0031EAC581